MKTKFKIFLLLSISCFFFAATTSAYSVEKVIAKSFEASKGYTLSIENKYGSINVQEWDRNEISFEIKISAEAKKQQDAEDRLNSINVEFKQSGKTVAAKTVFDPRYKSCNNCSFEIRYQVMVPKGINYVIDNMYGNVNIPNVEGNTNFVVKYGNLTTGNLSGSNTIDVKYGDYASLDITGANNAIDVKYGKINIQKLMGQKNTVTTSYGGNVYIGQTNILNIDIKYSKLKIDSADELVVESGYSNANIGKVTKLQVNSKYENYTIGEVNELNAYFGYSNVSIKKLNNSLKVSEIKYGKLNVDYVASHFSLMDVTAKYTNVNIKFDGAASYQADLYTKYGSINVPSGQFRRASERDEERANGTVGNSSIKSLVKIKNSYANITLK